MYPLFFDQTIILLIPAIILAFYAQAKVRGAFDRYSRGRSNRGLTGAQVARRLLDTNGLSRGVMERTYGLLSDHYDPRRKVLRLSEQIRTCGQLRVQAGLTAVSHRFPLPIGEADLSAERYRRALNVAAWTYVAAATVALMWLIRLLVLRGAQE